MAKINNKFISDITLDDFINDNFTENEIINIKDKAAFRMSLKQIREQNQLEQKDVAKRAGLKPSAVSRIETGNSNPTLDTILKVLEANDYTLAIVPR